MLGHIRNWLANLSEHSIKRSLDLAGIVVLFFLGLYGQSIVSYYIPATFARIPALSPRDWPGSYYTAGGLRDSTPPNMKRRRQFSVDMENMLGGWMSDDGVYISQRIIWIENLDEVKELWETPQFDHWPSFRSSYPVITYPLGEKNAGGKIYCEERTDTHQHVCAYLAYYRHWYTEVWFLTGRNEAITFTDIKRISLKAGEILVAAPNTL